MLEGLELWKKYDTRDPSEVLSNLLFAVWWMSQEIETTSSHGMDYQGFKCFSKKWGHQWKIELLNPHLWKEIVSELRSSECEEQTFSVAVLSEWELYEIRMQLILVTVFTVIFSQWKSVMATTANKENSS